MKVALFKDITWQHSTPTPCSESMETLDMYARVSEYVEVDFPPLSTDAAVKQQLDALDRTEKELRNQFQQKLGGIENRRAELQALTYVPAE